MRLHLARLVLASGMMLAASLTDAQDRKPDRDRIVHAVRKQGGTVQFDEQARNKPIVKISMGACEGVDPVLAQLKRCPQLHTLDL